MSNYLRLISWVETISRLGKLYKRETNALYLHFKRYRLAAERKARERREARQAERREERLAPIRNKMEEYKAKEDATMEMFRKMAQEQKNRGAY